MIIVVEGPDGLGKTTLCAELAGRLNCPVYKPWRQEGLELSGEYIFGHDEGSLGVALALANRADVIFDRSFPSDVAYSYAMDRDGRRSADYVQMDLMLAGAPHVGVMVMPKTPVLGYELAKMRGVNDVSQEQWVRVEEGYRRYLGWSSAQWEVIPAQMELREKVAAVSLRLIMHRESLNSKHHVFMEMARNAARRSTCLSRRQGAVLVSLSGHVIAVGYNGAPAGFPHPESCERLCTPSGQDLHKCNDSHAEENCIVHAALNGSSPRGGTMYTLMSPCHRCARMLINAGVDDVVYEREYDADAIDMLAQARVGLSQIGW